MIYIYICIYTCNIMIFPHLPGEGLEILSDVHPVSFFSFFSSSSGSQPRAACRSQWALPDLNCVRQISVGTARSQPRVADLRGHQPDPRENVRIDAK